jgi:hypothetical protein
VSTIADLRDLFLLIATDFGLMLTRQDAGDEPLQAQPFPSRFTNACI